MIVYVSIGNSDDKLSQADWSKFVHRAGYILAASASATHGVWFSAPSSEYQNACWCVDIAGQAVTESVQRRLRDLAGEFWQDSIAWAPAPQTEMLRPAGA